MSHTAIEYEAKILNINVQDLTAMIMTAGGAETGAALQRRHVYDIEPGDASRWVRLRDTGTAVTLAIKEIGSDEIGGTRETEIDVSDFATTHLLMGKLGYRPKAYQENHRRSFTLHGAQLEIDSWPLIPPYLEIEAADRDEVVRVATLLDFTEESLTGENTTKVYARHGIDLTVLTDLRFPASSAP